MLIRFKKLVPTARPLERAKDLDAGWDIRTLESIVLKPGEQTLVRTGIAVELDIDPYNLEECRMLGPSGPFSWYCRIAEKSGLADKKGIHVIGGVVDRGYTGEVKVVLANLGFFKDGVLVQQEAMFNVGDKIAQLVPTIIPRILQADQVDELSASDRGGDGFGSTGV